MERQHKNLLNILVAHQVFDHSIQLYAGSHIKGKEKEHVAEFLTDELMKTFWEEAGLVNVRVWEEIPPIVTGTPSINRWMTTTEALKTYGEPNSKAGDEWQYY